MATDEVIITGRIPTTPVSSNQLARNPSCDTPDKAGPLLASPRRRVKLVSNEKKVGAMRGVVFTGDRRLDLVHFDDPVPESADVVLEKASGLCGGGLKPRDQEPNRC